MKTGDNHSVEAGGVRRTGAWAEVVLAVLAGLLAGCSNTESEMPREITVRGVAEVTIPPDYVSVSTYVVTLDMDLAKAQAENDRRVRDVLAFVKRLGVEADDLSTGYASLQPKERHERDKPPVFEGYEASKNITVKLRDMTKYDELIAGILGLGVNRIGGISFNSAEEIKKRREARLMAIAAAKEKAQYLAEQLGQKVGKPLWIAEFRKETPLWGGSLGLSNAAISYRPDVPTFADTAQKSLAPGSITVRGEVEVCFELVD